MSEPSSPNGKYDILTAAKIDPIGTAIKMNSPKIKDILNKKETAKAWYGEDSEQYAYWHKKLEEAMK